MISRFFMLLYYFHRTSASTYEEFEPVWKNLIEKQNNSRIGFSKDQKLDLCVLHPDGQPGTESCITGLSPYGGNNYVLDAPHVVPDNKSIPPSYSLIPFAGLIDSDVKCGNDQRNFCNYPALPFVETLNIPQLLASANRLNFLPSGRCPDGYKKYPTKDCLNIAAAFIETTCCVYDDPVVNTKLSDYCSNRQGILFTATFELCDGRIFIVAGSTAWQINESFKILGGPFSLNVLTGGTVATSVDSALVDSSCNVGFFQKTNLRWMNFPGKTPSVDQTLSAILGAIPANLCTGQNCTPTAVNFAVCPNNGFCMVSVNLTSLTNAGATYRQLFLLAPGFNSFISSVQTPPGIAVTNNQDLKNVFQNYWTATFLRSSSRLAFTDLKNDVYFYDTTGKLLSGPTNLFDLFGVCTSSPTNKAAMTIYVPYPVFTPLNESAPLFPEGPPYQPRIPPVYYQQPASYNPPTQNYVQNPPTYNAPPPQAYYQVPATTAPAAQYVQPSLPGAPSYQNPIVPVYLTPITQQGNGYDNKVPYAPAPSYQLAPAPPAYQPAPAPPSYPPAPAQNYQPAPPPSYQPAPAPPSYQPAPAPPSYQPAPAPYTPAPYTSAPYTPAPYTPPPYTPAPYTQAPVTPAPYTPAPQRYAATQAPYISPPAAPQPAPAYGPPSPPVPPPAYRPPYNNPYLSVPADLAMYVPSIPTYGSSGEYRDSRQSNKQTPPPAATTTKAPSKDKFVPSPSTVIKVNPDNDSLFRNPASNGTKKTFFDLSTFTRNGDGVNSDADAEDAAEGRLILVGFDYHTWDDGWFAGQVPRF